MVRHVLAFLAALALAFSPLAVNAARAECDMGGVDAMTMSAMSSEVQAGDPCCDHQGKSMSPEACAKACAVSCAPSIVAPLAVQSDGSPWGYRIARLWSNTSGRSHTLIPEDPPPRSIA